MSDAKVPHAVPSEPPVILTAENRIEKFLEDNFKKIALMLLLVVALLAVWFVSRHFAAQRELEAAQQFTSAMSVEDCDVVVQKHPGSTAAGNALLQKAGLLWQQEKKSSSIETLQEFLKTQPEHKLRASASVALGSQQAAIGEVDAARTTLETFLKNSPQSELAPAADIQLGDLLLQDGKNEEATKHYDSLLQKYPGKMAMFNQALDERQQLMGSGLPQIEVDGPPPAPKPEPAALQPPQIIAPPMLPPAAAPAPVPPPAATPPQAALPSPATPVKPVPPAAKVKAKSKSKS